MRAVRYLAARPSFAITAIFTLALGIGASTAIYAVAYAVLLRPLPFPDADRLVRLRQLGSEGQAMAFSTPNVEDLTAAARSFESMATHAAGMVAVTGGAEPVRVRQSVVSTRFFDVLGVRPARGRTFVAEEQQPGGPGAVIVSHAFWQRELGGRSDVLDHVIRLGSDSHRIVGVMPADFDFPRNAALWTAAERRERLPSRTAHNWDVVARLRSGVELAHARAEIDGIARQLKQTYRDDTWMSGALAIPLREAYLGSTRSLIVVLSGAVGLLLLVSCATVANLLLSQGVLRQHEFAIRQAVGAGPWHLLRQLAGEHALLVAAGTALGLVLALAAMRALLTLVPSGMPLPSSIDLDANLLAFVLALATTLALLLALTTGVRVVLQDPRDALSGGGRGTVGHGTERVRRTLVIVQVAFALVLLAGAGLLGERLWRLVRAEPGFATHGLTVATVTFTGGTAEDATRIASELRTVRSRLAGQGAIAVAGAVSGFPLGDGSFSNGMFFEQLPGDVLASVADFERLTKLPGRSGEADFRLATPGYFEAMGIPVLRGRSFTDADTIDTQHVAVISASLARAQWPGQDPIGKAIQFGNMDGDLRPMTIVGIVGDVRESALDAPVARTFYGHAAQRVRGVSTMTFVARPSTPGSAIGPEVREVVRAGAPSSPVHVRDIADVVAGSFGEQRFSLAVVLAFGLTSLMLAVFGVYGVSSYAVSSRTREFGMRMALGAEPRAIIRLVLSEGAVLVGAGVVVGTTLAVLGSRVAQGVLADLNGLRGDVLLAAAAVLAVSALLAVVGPARRAARVPPVTAVRG